MTIPGDAAYVSVRVDHPDLRQIFIDEFVDVELSEVEGKDVETLVIQVRIGVDHDVHRRIERRVGRRRGIWRRRRLDDAGTHRRSLREASREVVCGLDEVRRRAPTFVDVV